MGDATLSHEMQQLAIVEPQTDETTIADKIPSLEGLEAFQKWVFGPFRNLRARASTRRKHVNSNGSAIQYSQKSPLGQQSVNPNARNSPQRDVQRQIEASSWLPCLRWFYTNHNDVQLPTTPTLSVSDIQSGRTERI
jgi:hypothetical protein